MSRGAPLCALAPGGGACGGCPDACMALTRSTVYPVAGAWKRTFSTVPSTMPLAAVSAPSSRRTCARKGFQGFKLRVYGPRSMTAPARRQRTLQLSHLRAYMLQMSQCASLPPSWRPAGRPGICNAATDVYPLPGAPHVMPMAVLCAGQVSALNLGMTGGRM